MFPMNWIPRGILFFSPNGTDVAGKPPRFAGIVKISCLYISTGSVIEPKSKASPDVVIVEGFFQYSFYGYIYKLLNKNIKLICSYERTSFTERNAQILRGKP